MRIKKTTETTPTGASVVNVQSNSTQDAYSCDYINDLVEDVYSTDEVKTNKVWIDGKPIYRKVTPCTSPSNNNNWAVIGNKISNIENVINIDGYISLADNSFHSVNFGEGSYYVHTCYQIEKGIKMIQNGWSDRPCYIVLEYTKTTD